MKTATLTRDMVDGAGTFGTLEIDNLKFATVERLWFNNERNESCVPAGEYVCHIVESHTNKNAGLHVAYQLDAVSDRDGIQIHVANWPSDLLGCIGLGTARAYVAGRNMVVNSKDAIQHFYSYMKNEPFILVIR